MTRFHITTMSITGREQENQDRIIINRKVVDNASLNELTSPLELAVLDGTNGAKDGIYASNYIAHVMTKDKEPCSVSRILDWNTSLINQKELLDLSPSETTTLSVLELQDNKLSLWNIGDSRIYQYRHQELTQLSYDHTSNNDLHQLGLLEDENMSDEKVVTRLCGMPLQEDDVYHITFPVLYARGDQFLLMTDGLSDVVSDNDIISIMSKASDIVDGSQQLITQAIDEGTKDNISIIIVEVVA